MTQALVTGAPATQVLLEPSRFDVERIGHVGLLHADGFWRDTIAWLRDRIGPWLDHAGGAGRRLAGIK